MQTAKTKEQRYKQRVKEAGYIRFELNGELAIYPHEREAIRDVIKITITNLRRGWTFVKDTPYTGPKYLPIYILSKDGVIKRFRAARHVSWDNVLAYKV